MKQPTQSLNLEQPMTLVKIILRDNFIFKFTAVINKLNSSDYGNRFQKSISNHYIYNI